MVEVSFFIPPIQLDGKITKTDLEETGGVAPVNTIRSDQSWEAQVEWYLEGWILNSNFFQFLGDWNIDLCLESMGPGPEYKFSTTVAVNVFDPDPNVADRRNYKTIIPINPGDVQPGVYTAVAAITYAANGVPGPIAGHREVVPPLMQVYAV